MQKSTIKQSDGHGGLADCIPRSSTSQSASFFSLSCNITLQVVYLIDLNFG